jgi:pilus assembly protein TadC
MNEKSPSFVRTARRLRFLPVPHLLTDWLEAGQVPSLLRQANLQEDLGIEGVARLKMFDTPLTFLLGVLLGINVGTAVHALVFGVAAAALGFFLPDSGIKQAAAARQRRISRSLPLAMEVIGLTVEKTSVEAAINYYCEYFPHEPLAGELARAMQRVEKFKEDLQVVLREMLDQNQNDDLSFLVAAVGQTSHLGGGDLRTLLVDQGTQLRSKQNLAAKTKSSRAPVALTLPTMLNVLAVIIVIGGLVALNMGSSLS